MEAAVDGWMLVPLPSIFLLPLPNREPWTITIGRGPPQANPDPQITAEDIDIDAEVDWVHAKVMTPPALNGLTRRTGRTSPSRTSGG